MERRGKEYTKLAENDIEAGDEVLLGDADSTRKKIFSNYEPLIAGIAYCIASTSMILLNKHVLSSFHFSCTNFILLFQNVVSVLFVLLGNGIGAIKTEPMQMRICKVWIPVNLIFVGMIWSSFFALKYLGVAMVTVLKNFTNVIVVAGDYFIYDKRHSAGIYYTLVLLFASVIFGASTDLSFNLGGYIWQMVNCFFTAGYSLTLRGVMGKVNSMVKRAEGMDEFSMVLYNNSLSIPFVLILMAQAGEFSIVFNELRFMPKSFYAAALASGVFGFAISLASLWFLSKTSATTYSITGSLNKIPTVAFSFLFFTTVTDVWNLTSIAFGLGAGLMFTWAKIKESNAAKVDNVSNSKS